MKSIRKALFLGSKEFGLEIFKSLCRSRDDVEWLSVCPDDSKDPRTHFKEFNEFTELNKINLKLVEDISSLKEIIEKYQPDIIFVVGFYQILPSSIIAKIPEGVWGIHNSLLPKYRGCSPLVWQLINGEEKIGSSLFRFSEGMDDGDILHQVSFKNSSKITIKSATYNLQELWKKCIPHIWEDFIQEKIIPTKQDHTQATYCSKRNENDGLIDWSMDANYLDRFIRAQTKPYPMAFFFYGNKIVRVSKHDIDSRIISGTSGQVFESRNSHVTICCGAGTAIKIFELEVNGKNYPASKVLDSTKIRL